MEKSEFYLHTAAYRKYKYLIKSLGLERRFPIPDKIHGIPVIILHSSHFPSLESFSLDLEQDPRLIFVNPYMTGETFDASREKFLSSPEKAIANSLAIAEQQNCFICLGYERVRRGVERELLFFKIDTQTREVSCVKAVVPFAALYQYTHSIGLESVLREHRSRGREDQSYFSAINAEKYEESRHSSHILRFIKGNSSYPELKTDSVNEGRVEEKKSLLVLITEIEHGITPPTI